MGIPAPSDSAPPSDGATRPQGLVGRRVRITAWSALGALAIAVVTAWLIAAHHPSLEPTGLHWQSPLFELDPESDDGFGSEEVWTAWDTQDGAAASTVLHNPRPYSVTVSSARNDGSGRVQIAAYDSTSESSALDPDSFSAVSHVTVPPGGDIVVAVHVSDRCYSMVGDSAIGTDVAEVFVTTFGVTDRLEVPLRATYLAGTTVDHDADLSCEASAP